MSGLQGELRFQPKARAVKEGLTGARQAHAAPLAFRELREAPQHAGQRILRDFLQLG